MRRHGIALSARHQRWFYTVTVLLFLSGAAWVLFRWLGEHAAAPANSFRFLQFWSLKLHGASAMAFLVALGILIPTHIKHAWRARRNRPNGAVLIAATALLVVTGYGLYYLGDEKWRAAASWLHLVLGVASPVVLVVHIWQGRRATARN